MTEPQIREFVQEVDRLIMNRVFSRTEIYQSRRVYSDDCERIKEGLVQLLSEQNKP